MPSMYESTTYLTIRNPTISEKVAPSLTDERLSERVLSMTQNLLSRSSLEPLVKEFDLFVPERSAGVPMEEILVRMRTNINVEYDRDVPISERRGHLLGRLWTSVLIR